MVWVDIAVIILLANYCIGGIIRGFGQEAFLILTWLIGIVVAWFFCSEFSVLLLNLFGKLSTRLAFSFLALILISLAIGWLIRLLLAGGAKKVSLTMLERVGGLVLGLVHGLLVVSVLTAAAGFTQLPKDRWWHKSKYLPPFQSAVVLVKDALATKTSKAINFR